MTTRTLLLTAAAIVVPALWAWFVPTWLARVWPRRPPNDPPRASLPDYEI